MRRYDKGGIVGERDVQVPFEEWLRSELQHAQKIIGKTKLMICFYCIISSREASSWYARGRLVALQEVSAQLHQD